MFQQVSAMQDQRAQRDKHAMDMQMQHAQTQIDLRTADQLGQQKVSQSQEAHKVKLQQMKQTQAAKPKTNGKGA